MLQLYRWPQTDEFPTPAAPICIDDGDVTWWAGAQRCFAGVAIAGAAAALGLSTAIAGTLWHNDDPVPQATPLHVDDDWWQAPAPAIPQPTFIVWASDEDVIPFTPGGGGVMREAVRVIKWAAADEWVPQPSPALDDTHWPRLALLSPWATPHAVQLPGPDDSWVPASIPRDADEWSAPPLQPVAPWVTVWQGVDERGTAAEPWLPVEADPWQPHFVATPGQGMAFWGDDEWPTPATPLTVDDEPWQPPFVAKPGLGWAFLGTDEWPTLGTMSAVLPASRRESVNAAGGRRPDNTATGHRRNRQ